jgi:hypothetical protein
MALNTLTATTQAVAVNYSYTTSGSTDWSGVTNNSYFYDLVTKLPYFKNNVGDIYHIFSGSTTGTTSNYTTGFTYSNNNLTISRNQGQPDLTVNVNTMTGLTINGNLSVTGNTSIKGLTGTSATISGSGQNILTLVGSGSTSPLFKISGSTNELFSVTDSTTGLLLTVNNNIGLPIFQTWDDFRVVMGSNATPGLTVSGSTVFVGPTATTTSKLYISTGTLQYNYGSLASGYILTSDSNGVATWQAPAGFNGGTVTGATIFNGGLSANTISATTYQNLPTDIRITGGTYSSGNTIFTNNTGGTFSITGFVSADTYTTGFTYSNNNLTISSNQGQPNLTVNVNTITGLTINGNLTVTGDTNVKGLSGTSATLSGSAQNILTIVGSGSTSPLFMVSGSSGEIFSVTDSLTGSLFSVNKSGGLPVLEIFSDYTTLIGDFYNPSLYTTTGITVNSGVTTTIYSLPTSAFTGAFFEYTVKNTDNIGLRAGNIMSIWSGNTVNFTETKTSDIGSTTGLTFSMSVINSGNTVTLTSSANTNNWIVKTIIRSI